MNLSKLGVSLLAFACVASLGAQELRADLGKTPAADPYAAVAAAVKDFHVIDAGQTLRGARPGANGIQALARANVRTVINLQGGDLQNPLLRPFIRRMEPGERPDMIEAERKDTLAAGMSFYSLPLNSMRKINAAEAQSIDQALEIMHNPLLQPVYIHCEHGHDRTGLLAALYRVRYDGWTLPAAHDEMKKDGHSGFVDYLVTHNMDKFFYARAPELAKLYAEEHRRHK